MNSLRLFVLLGLGWLGTAGASAQTYSIDWYTIDGGGGTSTGATYSVSGTIGQPDAGSLSGGNFSLSGGFWGLISVVQTPGAPLLNIVSGSGGVVLSWPSPSSGYVLQRTSSLATTNWSDVASAPSDNGSLKSLIVAPANGNQFYRLKK